MRGYYIPKVKYTNKYPNKCRECKKKTPDKDLIITGVDENNWKITQNASKNPICRECLNKQKLSTV
jgi:hypothetical protein